MRYSTRRTTKRRTTKRRTRHNKRRTRHDKRDKRHDKRRTRKGKQCGRRGGGKRERDDQEGKEEEEDEVNECPVCFQPTESRVEPCHHLLCRHCFNQLHRKVCPMCRRTPIWFEGEEPQAQQAQQQTQQMRPWVRQLYQQLMESYRVGMLSDDDEDAADMYDSLMSDLCSNPTLEILTSGLVHARDYDWNRLSANPVLLFYLLRQNLTFMRHIRWDMLATNPHPQTIPLLRHCQERNPDNALFRDNNRPLIHHLCDNPSQAAMTWLRELVPDPTQFTVPDWENLSANPAAVALLEAHPDKINWKHLSKNPSPFAIQQLEAHPDRIDWTLLSQNPGAVALLLQHPDRIHRYEVLSNPNPDMLPMIEQIATSMDTDDVVNEVMETALFGNPAIFTNYTWRLDQQYPG